MIRVINFVCVALMGLSVLALYHVSERTRVTHMRLDQVNRQIADNRAAIGVLQAEWERVAGPARIQALAQTRLGMSDATSAQMSSFDQLPARGADAPLNNSPLRNANAQLPAQPQAAPAQHISDDSGL
jgi:cell division protein FtsL